MTCWFSFKSGHRPRKHKIATCIKRSASCEPPMYYRVRPLNHEIVSHCVLCVRLTEEKPLRTKGVIRRSSSRCPFSFSFSCPQFYSWYFHTLPFLLWQTNFPVAVRLAVLCGVEFGFNVFPATPISSVVLQVIRFDLALGGGAKVVPRCCDAAVGMRKRGFIHCRSFPCAAPLAGCRSSRRSSFLGILSWRARFMRRLCSGVERKTPIYRLDSLQFLF